MNMAEYEEQVADYAWLGKNRRSWVILAGNPFCVSRFTIPLRDKSREEVVRLLKKDNERERKRFAKSFPDVVWEQKNT